MAHEPSVQTTQTSSDLTRTIVDAQGRIWFVREVAEVRYDRRGGRSLLFSTDEVMRRVRDYPADWRTFTDEELYALSLHR